uniref:Uncharacterized protein n=1 Tax=Anguilla anguilla TaxID=7936 RepID=A0A0E9THD1_ANGAN
MLVVVMAVILFLRASRFNGCNCVGGAEKSQKHKCFPD